jgi:hypothetical protein
MSWLHRVLGKDGASQLGVDEKFFAASVAGRPMHVGPNGGAYGLAVESGIMAAGIAGNAEIFQARWVHATFKCILRSIQISVWRAAATAFTAGPYRFSVTDARGWTADGGGGTPVIFSTNNTNKKRTDFPLSKFSDTGVRFSATAALTAGTKTLDTNPFGIIGGFTGAVAPAATVEVAPQLIPAGTYLWQRNTADEYPHIYEQNEGPVVRCTIPATGTWAYALMMEWMEVDPAEVEGWA